ncbi:MAG: chromate efflux transporter [Candidatus Dormiibacterota bacterium]
MTGSTGTEVRPISDRVSLPVIAREWGRIGCIGFGGPPTHIALLRQLCVVQRRWLSSHEFEDGIAATNLLPGPASTQLAIFCAWRLRGAAGALVGGLCFILPGLTLIIGLSALFLASHPPRLILGAAAGAGAAVAAVALNAALGLVPPSWRRIGISKADHWRWTAYALCGATAAATIGSFLVLVLLAAGLTEVTIRRLLARPPGALHSLGVLPLLAAAATSVAGIGALAWEAFKVGALSYGGGFVIVPLMQADVVHAYHWMTGGQFLNAVALGQVTPGPVVQTVAVVGFAAAGLGGALLAALFAFAPSFAFILLGGRHFDKIRGSPGVRAFLTGAGPAAIGAIAGSAIPLGLALTSAWQVGVLGAALIWILGLRRNVVIGLVGAAAVGVCASVAGLPVGN